MSHRTNDRAGLRRHGGKAYRRGAPAAVCSTLCNMCLRVYFAWEKPSNAVEIQQDLHISSSCLLP